MSERYFVESWFRGKEAEAFRSTTRESDSEPHPHVTFDRPFKIIEGREELVKQKIVDYCRGKEPIKFILEGKGNFGDIEYVPVISNELQEFDRGLEELLEGDVVFEEKLNSEKILHVRLYKNIDSFPRTESTMTRLVCLRDKKIWFSYDFVEQQILTREESLKLGYTNK